MVGGSARRAHEGARAARHGKLEGGWPVRHAQRRSTAQQRPDVPGRVQGSAHPPATPTRAIARGTGGLIVAQMNMTQALNSAMDIMLERDSGVLVLGQDVG